MQPLPQGKLPMGQVNVGGEQPATLRPTTTLTATARERGASAPIVRTRGAASMSAAGAFV